jgi:4'-phosphopantetheinyl transferase
MPDIQIQWGKPPPQRSLPETYIHVWAATLEASPVQLSAFETTLSPDEHDRARRFHFERDRKHFIAGRGILRAILGFYLQIEPGRLQFKYGSHGKPILANLPDNHPLHFNLAHSDGLLLVAASRLCPVGIDVERIRLVEDMEDLMQQFFSPLEAAGLRALPVHQHAQAFFNLWTRKEACLKATGDGISERLQGIAVSFLPGEPARILKPLDSRSSAMTWTLKELNPAPDYAAAIAAATHDLNVSCWLWAN